MMKKRWVIPAISTAVLLVLGFFQNCSGVKFDAHDGQASSLSTDGPLAVQQSDVAVNAQQVPPLKLFFVVDNSYTMIANQVKLAQAFDQMFKGATSLAKFDVTAFLISTAQTVPAFNSGDLNAIAQLQIDPTGLSLLSLPNYRNATLNSGALPGDNLGYRLAGRSSTGVTVVPMPVLGSSDGSSLAQPGIHKAAGADYTPLSQEFQSRLALLNSNRIPQDANFNKQNGAIVDRESALCAISRILRNNQNFVQPNEQAAFVIASDEDENDPAGSGCVQSYAQVTGTTPLIKGSCETRQTVINYTVGTSTPAKCTYTYDNGYYYTYTYPTSTPAYDITYKNVTAPAQWSAPRTKVSYSLKQTSYYNIVTKVTYYTCDPVYDDGVLRAGECRFRLTSGQVAGDQTGACAAAAQQVDGKPLSPGAPAAPQCQKSTVAATSCAAGSSTCDSTVSFNATSGFVSGSASNCAQAAQSLNAQAIVDGSQPLTCASSPQTGTGACPAGVAGCTVTSNATYGTAKKTQVTGDFSTPQKCLAQAQTYSGQASTSTGDVNCVSNPKSGTASRNGNIAFAASGDNGSVTIAAGQPCPAATFAQASSGLPGGGSCQITGHTQSVSANGDASSSAACTQSAAAAGAPRNGHPTFSPASTGTATKSLAAVPRDIQCADTCASSNNVVCNGNADPNVTVQQYLAQAFGATACSRTMTVTQSQAFADKALAQKDQACVGSAAQPQYLVWDGTNYTSQKLVTDFAAGYTELAPNNDVPAMSLSDYVVTRSATLFGALKPMTSVFVRVNGDPVGDGGSTGTTYMNVAAQMGGQSASVLSADYGAALANLSGILQARLQRAFVVAGMKPYQMVHAVQIQKNGVGAFVALPSSAWNASGTTVTIDPATVIGLNDVLRFQFY